MASDGPRDIDLVLLTGAGASYNLGASGTEIAAMREWSDRLTGALGVDGLIVGLAYQLEGIEFERRLGKFLAAARAFRETREFILSTGNLTYGQPGLQTVFNRQRLETWHEEVSFRIDQVFQAIHDTLYQLFGNPSFDLRRATRAYDELLAQLWIEPPAANWVYATTNYDKIGDEALEQAGFRVAWGERQRVRSGDRLIDPDGLLDGVGRTVPVLHLHGRIGWYRRSDNEGGATYAADMVSHNPGFGTPIVMLPDPNKAYESDPIIDLIWGQFEEALSRAKRVLVLGHSLNDGQIVEALRRRVEPSSLAITVLGHEAEPQRPAWNEDPVLQIRDEHFPQSTLVPIRFGMEGAPQTTLLREWLASA